MRPLIRDKSTNWSEAAWSGPIWPTFAWGTVAAAGIVGPALAMLAVAKMGSPASFESAGSAILAVGLMGSGMIAAAAAGRFLIGVLLAIGVGASLVALLGTLGFPTSINPLPLGAALVVASISFAARGALFARSVASKGWWVAVFVVAGEAAILLTAVVSPGLWPDWLLALLPAQWANLAFRASLTGGHLGPASTTLIALGSTALATLLVAWLWPRRWPYLIMFTTWLAMAALVYNHPGSLL
ncbi:MAG: hypothetical protein AAF697_05650 [Pseudomonadota bacterium]